MVKPIHLDARVYCHKSDRSDSRHIANTWTMIRYGTGAPISGECVYCHSPIVPSGDRWASTYETFTIHEEPELGD